MLAALRQRLVLLLALIAGLAFWLARHGRQIGFASGGLGPALDKVFTTLGSAAVIAIGIVVVLRLVANAKGVGSGFARIQAAVANGLVAALLGIAMFEAFARWHDPLPARPPRTTDSLTGVNRPDERLGWSGRPGFDKPTPYRITAGDGQRREILIRLRNNSQGFRDPEQVRDFAKPGVVVVGDSYAWGHCVELEETAVHGLRKQLPAAQVYNLACQAYSLDQIALSYEVYGRPLKPKVVVAMFLYVPGNMRSAPLGWGLQKPWFKFVGRELSLEAATLSFGKDAEERRMLVDRAEATGVYDLSSAVGFLVRDFGSYESWFLRRGAESWDRLREKSQGVPPPAPIVYAILSRLKKAVEADGAKLLLATGPEDTLLRWERIVRAEHAAAEEAAGKRLPLWTPFSPAILNLEQAGFEVLDFTEALLPEGEVLYDRDMHPGVAGNERMASALRARVEALLAR